MNRNKLDLKIRKTKPDPSKKQRIACGDGLCLVINKGGSKVFTSRYRLGDDKNAIDYSHRPSYPELSVAEAFTQHYELQKKVAAGIDPKLENREKATRELAEKTLNDAADEYFSEGGPAARKLRETTFNDYKNRYDRWTRPSIGIYKLKNIDTDDFILHIKSIADNAGVTSQNKGDGTRTASIVKTVITQIFNDAVVTGKLKHSSNPTRGVTNLMLEIQQKEKKNQRVLDLQELVEVIRIAKFQESHNILSKKTVASIILAILTGMRRQEIIGMLYSELTICSDGTAIYNIPAERMKAGSNHKVLLSNLALKIINGLTKSSDFVFQSDRYEDRPLNKETMNNGIRYLLGMRPKVLSPEFVLSIPRFSPHDLRRSFSTGLRREFKAPKILIHSMIAHGPDDDEDSEKVDTRLDKIYVIDDEFEEKKKYWYKWSELLEEKTKKYNLF